MCKGDVLQNITKITMVHRMSGIHHCKGHDRPDFFTHDEFEDETEFCIKAWV